MLYELQTLGRYGLANAIREIAEDLATMPQSLRFELIEQDFIEETFYVKMVSTHSLSYSLLYHSVTSTLELSAQIF